MLHEGKTFLRVFLPKDKITQKKDDGWKKKVFQSKVERQIHKDIEGEFLNLDVSPRTVEEFQELELSNLSVLPERKQKSKKKFIKK